MPFTWELHNSLGGQQGTGTAPVAANGRSDLAINLGIPCAWPWEMEA